MDSKLWHVEMIIFDECFAGNIKELSNALEQVCVLHEELSVADPRQSALFPLKHVLLLLLTP